MKIKNLRLATLLVAMTMGAQSAFAQDVSTYNELQTAIQNSTSPIELTGAITDVTGNLETFSGSSMELSGGSISGTSTDGTRYRGINNTGSLAITNTALKDFSTAITNSGTLTLNNVTFSNNTDNFVQTSTGNTTFTGTNTLSGASGTGTINNTGNLTLSDNNSRYTGNFNQNSGTTTVNGQFFGGGTSTIKAGTFNWNSSSDIAANTKLIVQSGATLNLETGKTLSIRSGSSIASGATTNIKSGSTMNVAGGSVSLNSGDTYAGDVNLTSGTLTLDGITNSGKLIASGGTLNLNSGTTTIGSGSSIASAVTTKINSTLDITAGSVTLDSSDTWSGTVKLNGGNLDLNSATNNGTLTASTGNLNLNSGNLALGAGSSIAQAVKTNIAAGSQLNISGGTVLLDGNAASLDNWSGTVNISAGELTLNNITNGTLNATGGKITLNSQILNIAGTSKIDKNVQMIINNGSSINISNNVTLDNADTWNGNVNLKNGGTLTLDKAANTGALNAENGTLDIKTGSNITIGSGSKIDSAVITKIENGATVNITSGNVTLSNTDSWAGTILVNGGVLAADGVINNGILEATTGAVNVLTGKTLNINSNSSIDKDVITTIADNAKLNITGGDVSLNNSDLWNGTVEISSGNLTINNKQGKLNATGGNVKIEAGDFTVAADSNISGANVTVDSPATLIFTKNDTIKNITGQGTLKANGATLTFNNGTTLGESLKLASQGNSKYIISANADSILNKVKAGTNSGLTLEINNTNSSTDLTIDGTSISNLDFKNTVNYSGALTNNGNVSNTGTLTMSNTMSGNGTFTNSNKLTITGDQSGFTGTFTQTAGSTTINNNGKISSGDKNINGGSLNITSGELINYDKVHLGNNASLSHTTTVEGKNTVSSSVVNFTGSGATAKFAGGQYELSEKIDNGKNNTVRFENSTVTLGNTDYKGSTIYNFTNSTLDLLEEGAAAETNDYTFGNVTTNNATLNFNVNIKADGTDGDRILETDTITITNGSDNTKFKFGKIHITGEENGKRGKYTTNKNVLTGAQFATNPAKPTIIGATTTWQYDVTSSNNGHSIALEIKNYTDNHTLYNMNDTEGTRFFQFSENDNRVYNIAESLGETKEGTFNVSGNNKTSSIISGSDLYSMFDIKSGTNVELNIADVTLQNANKTGNGSAVNNESTTGVVNIANAIIKNNGGDSAVHNAGTLNIQNTEFTGNTGKDITQVAGGSTIFEGTNKISSGIKGDGSIENKGTLTLGGDNSEYIGSFTQTAGSTTVTDKFFGGGTSTIEDGTLYWHTTNDINSNTTLTAKKGILNIGKDKNQKAILSINNGSSIAKEVTTTINEQSTLNVSGGEVNLNNGDKWLGTVNLTDGTLNVDNIQGNGKLVASNGNLNLENGNLIIAAQSEIQETVKTTIASTSSLRITGGNVTLDSATNDSWEGAVIVTDGELTIKDMASNGAIAADGGKITLETGKLDIANKDSQITEKTEVILKENTITNISNKGGLALNKGDQWLGTINVDKDGLLTINNIESNKTLNVTDGTVNLISGKLVLDNTSSIKEAATTIIKGNMDIEGATVELNNNDSWTGAIKITDGQLDLNNITGNGKFIAENGGIVNINSGSLTIAKGSEIKGGENSTAVNIKEGSNLYITGGNVTLNANDTWDGFINLKAGTLNIDDRSSNKGILHADGGNLNFSTGTLTIENGSYIDLDVVVALPENSVIDILKGGTVAINDNDIWNGEITLNGGVLNYGTTHSGTLTANTGDMNLLSGSILNIQIPSQVADEVNVDIQKDALVNIKNNAKFNLDSKDKWSGMINNSGGELTTTNLTNSTLAGGGLQQTAGSSTFKDNSHIFITDDNSYITGGDLNILNNSSLFLGADTAELRVDNLKMENNSLLNMMNNKINTSRSANMIVNDKNNISINISPRDWKHDRFIINNIKSDSEGVINISDFDFLGLCPIDRHIKLRLFEADSIKNVTFDTTDKEIFTPIGWYNLQSAGGGYFTSNLTRYNPQVFRGQVSTLAMYNNQLAIDDMLLNHVSLQSERFLAQGQNANRYAITTPQFAPYQYTKEDGGLWFKNYVNFETLTMTQNLNVHNTAYGSIIGADFPVQKLKRGWEFMPTAYVGYNGSQQSYSNMHMYQNGGQAGFMGSFMKNDFVGSVLAYGGAYYNEMQVAGVRDEAMNWFAGTAAKAAYNFHTSEHFTIQPTAFVSYNFFGKQNWGTDYGIMSMNSGMLNGVNVAPGVNFIYARESWNIYLTVQYMYNINDGVSGNAGNVQLHDVRMRHGYMQYGIGATKTWKDRLNSYVQLVFRNGGRTGIGVQLGAQYLFDWSKPKNSEPKPKSTIKAL